MEIPTPQDLKNSAKNEEIYRMLKDLVAEKLHQLYTGNGPVDFGVLPSYMPNEIILERLIEEVKSKGWCISIWPPNSAGVSMVRIQPKLD